MIEIKITNTKDSGISNLGEVIHNALAGSPAYKNDEIVLSVDSDTDSIYLIIGNNNDSDVSFEIDVKNVRNRLSDDMLISDIKTYVRTLIEKGTPTLRAKKSGSVIARYAEPGEVLVVYTKNGNIEGHETCLSNDIVLTRADDAGNLYVDKFGHVNRWKVTKSDFLERYVVEDPVSISGVYHPKGKTQLFIGLSEDIVFMAPWGEKQTIRKGGLLNITNPDKIYGIANEEFNETYDVCL